MPYYIGDLKRDPDSENHPYSKVGLFQGLGSRNFRVSVVRGLAEQLHIQCCLRLRNFQPPPQISGFRVQGLGSTYCGVFVSLSAERFGASSS